jgi:hypothetical protein
VPYFLNFNLVKFVSTVIGTNTLFIFFSFPTEFQFVADAIVIVSLQIPGMNQLTRESLYPLRHKLTLPLNGLNMLFGECNTAFNFHTKLDSDRNYFLDFDGTGLISSLEQNFNPSVDDIAQREKNGYVRLLSGDVNNLENYMNEKQKIFFPEDETNEPWNTVNQPKRYYMAMPFYPFRTVCPRDSALYPKMSSTKYNSSSPIFPANTQMNIVLHRRKNTNFLDFMLPYGLNYQLGNTTNQLTQADRTAATQFRVANDEDQNEVMDIPIVRVDIQLNNIYLQVLRLKYKNVNPERPLSNIFNSYRTVFTPLQRVSFHQYDLGWESAIPPVAVYIGFVKDTDIQYQDNNRIFHTPGIYYRPNELKSMQALLNNTESRTTYNNFKLDNLNTNTMDYSHLNYEKYLQNNYFLPLGERKYFDHTRNNIVPIAPVNDVGKGLFNVFPLSLESEQLNPKNYATSSLGVISQSPLKLEIQLEPVPAIQWFLFFTFVYRNKITFTGSKTKQDIIIDYLK